MQYVPLQQLQPSADTQEERCHSTFNGQQDDARVVVGDHVGVTVLGLVHFEVGVLPGELLARVNGLEESGKKTRESEKSSKSSSEYLLLCGTDHGSEDLAEERNIHLKN